MNERLNPLRGIVEKVALSGSYNDLKGKPAIPSTLDGLTDGVWKPGDTAKISMLVANGFITNGANRMAVGIYLGKPISEKATPELRVLTGYARGLTGYIDNTLTTNQDYMESPFTSTIYRFTREAGYLYVFISKSSAFANISNNTPISVIIDELQVEFVEATGDEPMPGPDMFDDF